MARKRNIPENPTGVGSPGMKTKRAAMAYLEHPIYDALVATAEREQRKLSEQMCHYIIRGLKADGAIP